MQTENKTSSKKNSKASKNDKAPTFPYAYRFLAVQDYFKGSLTDKGALLLEYLIMIGELQLKKGNDRFFHSKATIKKRTGISPNTATNLIGKFEEYGFLESEVVHEDGRPITYFRMKYARIARCLGILFGDEEVEHSPAELARIKQRQEALQHMLRLQVALRKYKQALLAK